MIKLTIIKRGILTRSDDTSFRSLAFNALNFWLSRFWCTCIPYDFPSFHWLNATGQCVMERYPSATMSRAFQYDNILPPRNSALGFKWLNGARLPGTDRFRTENLFSKPYWEMTVYTVCKTHVRRVNKCYPEGSHSADTKDVPP